MDWGEAWDRIRQQWPLFTVLAATAALFYAKDMYTFLATTQFAGTDLASNYAFTHLMEQNLAQGEIFRWSNQWLLGFPSFTFYPPLFFFLTASLHSLTGIGLPMVFKTLVFLSVFLLPATVYLSFRNVWSRMEAFFAAFYSLYFLFVYPPLAHSYQAMSVGLVAQGFAFLLLIPGIALTLATGLRRKIFGGVLLGLTILVHPFVGMIGGIVALLAFFANRADHEWIPLAATILIPAFWLYGAFQDIQFFNTFSMGPGEPGTFLFLLLPLILVGGFRGRERRILLTVFLVLFGIGVFDTPFVTQEVRFFGYALGIGSILAGMGAYRLYTYLADRYGRKTLIALALFLPVVALSMHADVSQEWQFGGDNTGLYETMEGMEQGRVMVETTNSSIFDAYVLQAYIPLQTHHWAVNDVHLDSSPSANYILTLEDWISEEMLINTICRTCNEINPDSELLDKRMDDLGVRYLVAKTGTAAQRLNETFSFRGGQSDYWLFENTAGYELVEPVKERPVALHGSWEKWKQVNDRLFVSNLSVPVVWLEDEPAGEQNFSAVIDMEFKEPDEVVAEVRNVEPEPVPAATADYTLDENELVLQSNRSTPVNVKISYMPSHAADETIHASNFNTMLVFSDGRTTMTLD